MAQKNRTNMLADIVNNIYTNIVNFITGNIAQQRLINLLDSSPNILSDKDQANGYVGTTANNEMFSGYYSEEISEANLITKLAANLAIGRKFYNIIDAVGSTKNLIVIAESNVNLFDIALDTSTGATGVYDINTGTFTPYGGGNSWDATVVAGGLAAANKTQYIVTASATFTDPTPAAGEGYLVFIRNGTATIGGTAYSTAGSIVWRVYHSGAWANYYQSPYNDATSSIQTQLNAKLAIASGNNYRLTATDGSGNRGDISAITASRVLVSDANGLPTHSSVTESILNNLPYNSKISSAGDGTGVTGTTSNTLSKSLLIPANSRAADSCSHIEVSVKKVGTAGTLAVRIYWNTSNSLTGAILIASSTGNAAGTLWLTMIRTLGIEVAAGTGNGTTVLNTAVAANNQYGAITTSLSNVAIDWTVAGYFIVAVQNGSSADTSTCNQILLH